MNPPAASTSAPRAKSIPSFTTWPKAASPSWSSPASSPKSWESAIASSSSAQENRRRSAAAIRPPPSGFSILHCLSHQKSMRNNHSTQCMPFPPRPGTPGEGRGEGQFHESLPQNIRIKMRGASTENSRLIKFAREMRTGSTDAEKNSGSSYGSRLLSGYKFRRQHPMAGYISGTFTASNIAWG